MPRTLDVLTISEEYKRVCSRFVKMLGSGKVKHFAYQCWEDIEWTTLARTKSTPLLVISRVADIPSQKRTPQPTFGKRERRYLFFTGQMPPEALPARVSRLNIRDEHRLHIAKPDDPQQVEGIIARAICCFADSESNRIVDAWWEGEDFVVLSPDFRRLVIPLGKLCRFFGNDLIPLNDYEVDSDGSFIYWQHADVHLGWMQFLWMVEPLEAMAAKAKRRKFNERYGMAIRAVRIESGLRQADILRLSARQVGRIENGECRATHSALSSLADAHDMNISDYLELVARKLR